MTKSKTINLLFWGILTFYLLLMCGILFFLFRPEIGVGYTSVNLVPFKSIMEGINIHDGIRYRMVDEQVWANIVLFIPAGIYLMVLRKKNAIVPAFFMIFLMSLGTELIQYVCRIGVSDVDDIILNCLGGLLGILAYRLLEKICKTKEKAKRIVTYLSVLVGLPVLLYTCLLFVMWMI